MVKIYKLKKKIPDSKIDKLGNTFVKPNHIDLIIDHDADVYNEDGKILLKFRKNKLRETMFSEQHHQKFKKLLPLIKEIDVLYKKYIPDRYAKQIKKARQTHFKIPNTSFTTVTTNLNFKTAIHRDKGDDIEGFGNLAVIEKGKYKGAETCLPQYGVGVNVRTGDILYMDVHQWHGNLPMVPIDKDAKRLSIVCYLRKNLWARTKGKTKSFLHKHLSFIRKLKTKKKK